MNNTHIIKDLGDGLILRRATPADAETLTAFNARIHSDEGPDKPDERIGAWVNDLLTKSHPTTAPSDFTVVEDTQKGEIVSSMNLIPQTWSYEGLEFGVGRPELVGTDPEYRKRGLVRSQFEVIHQWSEERGHKLQGITGIPYYYRQFGYEMTIALDGGRVGYMANIPKLEKDKEEQFTVRPASEKDLPYLIELYNLGLKRHMIACQRDESIWRYELCGKGEKNISRSEFRIIETNAGEAIGYLAHPAFLWDACLTVTMYELKKGVPWLDVTHSVLRYLKATGEAYAAEDGDAEFGAFAMWLGNEHPVYHAIDDRLPRKREPYAWYIRVPDIVDFLLHIKPVFEERLATSVLVGYSGELKLNFFRSGVKFTFEEGKIKEIVDKMPESPQDGDVLFPDLTFLRVLFGYNDFGEVEKTFADCFARNDHGRALMPILFPKKASKLWPIS